MRFAPNPATLWARFAGAILLCSLASAAMAGGFHGDHPDDKREILQLENQWRAAQLAGDLLSIDRLLADDYVGINVTGQVNTKAQFLNRVRNHELMLSRIDLREIKVKLLGDVAVVTVRATVQGTSHGAPLLGNFRYTRIYHRVSTGGWKITNFEATRIPSRHATVLPVAGHRSDQG